MTSKLEVCSKNIGRTRGFITIVEVCSKAERYNGFTELSQVDPSINGLNGIDQGLLKIPQRVANFEESVSKTDERIDKLADQLSTLVEIISKNLSLLLRLKRLRKFVLLVVGLMLGTIVLIPISSDLVGEVLRFKKKSKIISLSGSTTPLSDSCPSLTSFETSDSFLGEFANELALLDPFPPGNEDVDRFTDEPAPVCLPPPGDDDDDESFLKEDLIVQEENFQVYSNPLFEFDDNYNSILLNTPFFDEDECFDPGGDNDEIDAFLAIEISTYIEEGYYDSEGDVFYLEKLLIDGTSLTISEVFFDHEPQCFKDELDTLENMVIIFDPGIWEETFSLLTISNQPLFLCINK
ncbi:hypothetical protein Tco_0660738 [Tanacetum coccineum]